MWKMTKASFDESIAPILAAIMARVDTEFSNRIAEILALNDERKIKKALGDIKIVHIDTNSAYFTTILSSPSLTDDGDSPTTSISFTYQAYSAENEAVGEARDISWKCSRDQAKSVMHLMKSLGEGGLRGDIVETCSMDYILQLCNVLDMCIDPSKLGARIDKINGIRAETDGDDVEDTGDVEEKDGTEPITPVELSRLLKEQIEGESEAVRYDFGQKRANVRKSTRVQNGLAAMGRVCAMLSDVDGFKQLGDHVDCIYAKFLVTKLSTEIKSFISNGNSLYRYV